jgi:hypothetical protein
MAASWIDLVLLAVACLAGSGITLAASWVHEATTRQRISCGLSRAMHHRLARLGVVLALFAAVPFAGLGVVWARLEPAKEFSAEEFATLQAELQVPVPVHNPDSPLTTDLGRTVRTLRSTLCGAVPTAALLAAQDRLLECCDLRGCVIQVPHGWQDCNCHGYVFTNGRHWIGGKEIDPILHDNEYEPVYTPRSGDLVIYRDTDGEVNHSGIVRGIASDGVVLVESKFGQAGRFIHPYNRQPYPSTTYTFYRSPRPGHLLQGVHTTPSDLPAPSSTPSSPAQPTTPPSPHGALTL